jgi:hypothetical protein
MHAVPCIVKITVASGRIPGPGTGAGQQYQYSGAVIPENIIIPSEHGLPA